ncbi:outer membrane beta-barrel protein [Vibrio maritimus]|uniref:outer membrane beta-barrel protein n=1 Tax=Vibrio maritimus TaxID=990268 RepID=UPI001F3DB937|nr:outer membrane beta-barrel protein [Vibrio maritimus]
MKKLLLVSLLAPSLAFAGAQNAPYVGGQVGLFNKVELEMNGISLNENVDGVPFALFAGYEMAVADNVGLGFELEYRNLSDANFQNVLKLEGQGVSLNLKPKFYIKDLPIYVGLVGGIGQYKTTATELITANRETSDSTDLGWQYGVDFGYEAENGFAFTVGYRGVYIDFEEDGVDLNSTISGFNAGIYYRF